MEDENKIAEAAEERKLLKQKKKRKLNLRSQKQLRRLLFPRPLPIRSRAGNMVIIQNMIS